MFWRARIQKVIKIALKSDGYGVEAFLSMFGGMGDFSDICPKSSDAGARSFTKNAAAIAHKRR